MKGDWKARRERVDAAVVAFDFLGWLAGRYGQVNPGRKSQLVRAPYREDRKPSLSLYQQGGVTFWKDQADGTSGTVLQWLTRHEGMSLPQAEDFLLEAVFGAGAAQLAPVNWANIRPQRQPEPEPAYTGPSEPTLRAFEEGQRRMAESGRFPAALADCPLDPDTATTWGLSAKGDEGLIGIFDLEGRIHAVKVRANSQTARYRYMDKGAHNPVWHCPYIQACEGTLTVFEGEKKAIAASAALFASEVSARWGVAGLPGASSRPRPEWFAEIAARGFRVVYFPDPDQAGREAAKRFEAECRAAGLEVYVADPVGDCWDVAREEGLEGLCRKIHAGVNNATLGYSEAAMRGKALGASAALVLPLVVKFFALSWGMHASQMLSLLQNLLRDLRDRPHRHPYLGDGRIEINLSLTDVMGWADCSQRTARTLRAKLCAALELTASDAKTTPHKFFLNTSILECLIRGVTSASFTGKHIQNDDSPIPTHPQPAPDVRNAVNNPRAAEVFAKVSGAGYVIYEDIRECGWRSARHLSRKLGLSPRHVKECLAHLVAAGFLVQEGRRYSLAPTAEASSSVYRDMAWHYRSAKRRQIWAAARERRLEFERTWFRQAPRILHRQRSGRAARR